MGLNMPARSTYRDTGLHITVSSGYTCCLLATVPLHCIQHETGQPSTMQQWSFLVFSPCSGSGFCFHISLRFSSLVILNSHPSDIDNRSHTVDFRTI